MKLKALASRKSSLNRNLKGPVLYVAYNRRLKKYYVGVTKNTFNDRYSRRDYKHHFSNAFYYDPTAFDVYCYKFKSLAAAYKMEEQLVTWKEAKSDKYYNKIPGGGVSPPVRKAIHKGTKSRPLRTFAEDTRTRAEVIKDLHENGFQ